VRAFLNSAALHLLLIAGAWFVGHTRTVEKAWNDPARAPIAVEFSSDRSKKHAKRPSTASANPKSGGRGGVALSDLALKQSHLGNLEAASGGGSGAAGKGNGPMDGYAAADAMGIHEEGLRFSYYEALWRRIDSHNSYPQQLVEDEAEGTVELQLRVDETGQILQSLDAPRGPQPLLNAWALAVSYAALSSPLPTIQRRQQVGIETLVLHFTYRLYGEGGVQQPLDTRHFKNLMWFRRDAKAESVVTKEYRKLVRLLPPIIPIPGGFFVDVIGLARFIQVQFSREPSTAERERRIRESFKGRLDRPNSRQ